MRPIRTLTIIATSLICLTACHKTTSSTYNKIITCGDQYLYARFSGYQDTELSSAIVRTYVKDSAFSTLVSEEIDTISHKGWGDGYHNVLEQLVMAQKYDYEIILAGVNDTFRISHITMPPRSETSNCYADDTHVRCVPEYCFNPVQLEKIYLTKNGQPDTPVGSNSFAPGASELLIFRR